jgi:esterase/lipase
VVAEGNAAAGGAAERADAPEDAAAEAAGLADNSATEGWDAADTADLVRSDRLPEVTQPLLMFRSVEDHVVDGSSAAVIRARVSSRDLTERLLENSYHVATLDHDAPTLFEESAQFIRRVTGP